MEEYVDYSDSYENFDDFMDEGSGYSDNFTALSNMGIDDSYLNPAMDNVAFFETGYNNDVNSNTENINNHYQVTITPEQINNTPSNLPTLSVYDPITGETTLTTIQPNSQNTNQSSNQNQNIGLPKIPEIPTINPYNGTDINKLMSSNLSLANQLRTQQLDLSKQLATQQLDYLKQKDASMLSLQNSILNQQKTLATQQLQAQLEQFNKQYQLAYEQYQWQKQYQQTLLNQQMAEYNHQKQVRQHITNKFAGR